MKKIVPFHMTGDEVAQTLGAQTQARPVPSGGMWLEMRGRR